MARKVQASLTFRKNTPGDRLASIRQMSEYEGQLYTFQYTSFGPNLRKPRPNVDKRPLLLLALKDGGKVWTAKNGKRYIYGFNLNYLNPARRLEVVQQLSEIFTKNKGVGFDYKMIVSILDLPSSKEQSIFRKYDVRGSKLRYLKEVNLDTYVEYLRNSTRLNS